jgi:hypothetical protein
MLPVLPVPPPPATSAANSAIVSPGGIVLRARLPIGCVRAEVAELAIEYREIAGKLLDLDTNRFELGLGAVD